MDRQATDVRPQILYLDAYDSFSNNIVTLLETSLQADVTTIRIDDARFKDRPDHVFHSFCQSFNGVVAGPGPGNPANAADVALIDRLWTLPSEPAIPVLGICLGFQSLVLSCGGSVVRLAQPRHGIVRQITHRGQGLFQDVGDVRATQYHSLHGVTGCAITNKNEKFSWRPAQSTPYLQPLAWDLSDQRNGPVLMAARHLTKPFFGVQYHPESICTNSEGAKIIGNWWKQALSAAGQDRSSCSIKRRRVSTEYGDVDSGYVSETEFARDGNDSSHSHSVRVPFDTSRPHSSHGSSAPSRVFWGSANIADGYDIVPEVVQMMEAETGHQPILLESGTKHGRPVRSETGRFSIIGLVEHSAERIQYCSQSHKYTRTRAGQIIQETPVDVSDVFDRLRSWTTEHKATSGPPDVPFWGGLVGYMSYEIGLETLDVQPSPHDGSYSDVNFVSVSRSIVVDHVEKIVYVQSLEEGSESWVQHTIQQLRCIHETQNDQQIPEGSAASLWTGVYHRPSQEDYCRKVEKCQSYIRAGDSYELCLTDQSQLTFHSASDITPSPAPAPWEIYTRLRTRNPAPFSAFLPLGPVDIMSSSPERFLSWTRSGTVQFRPIKGTVQKAPGVTRANAERILNSEKERAENLMIVDLIRHDLNGVLARCGERAEVPRLMQMEEYETVYQLVSVVQGQLRPVTEQKGATAPRLAGGDEATASEKESHPRAPVGLDVLQASLPPGSMTGAPKKRSCELLRELEGGKARGIYSGVLGYLDVGGGGDFAVVIRSVVRYPDGWRAGAGGAVTALSDPLAEYEEMLAKCEAVRL